MAQRTITRMYDRYADAQAVVTDLEAAGIPHDDISLVANANAHGDGSALRSSTGAAGTRAGTASSSAAGTGAGTGAGVGAALGGGVGLLAGLGALAIPGVGPVVAAGWLVATLAGAGVGAASGGLLGTLAGAGVGHDEANVYAEGVRGGSSLVTVRADETQAARVEELMNRHGPVDWQRRRTEYGPDWTGFDETSHTRLRDFRSGQSRMTGTSADVAAAPGAEGTYSPRDPLRRS